MSYHVLSFVVVGGSPSLVPSTFFSAAATTAASPGIVDCCIASTAYPLVFDCCVTSCCRFCHLVLVVVSSSSSRLQRLFVCHGQRRPPLALHPPIPTPPPLPLLLLLIVASPADGPWLEGRRYGGSRTEGGKHHRRCVHFIGFFIVGTPTKMDRH